MNFQIDLMIAALDKDEVEVAEGEDDDQFEQVTHAGTCCNTFVVSCAYTTL